MEIQDKMKFIKKLISLNDFDKTFRILVQENLSPKQAKKVINLENRYNTNESNHSLGVITYETYLLEKNRLIHCLLDLVDELTSGKLILPLTVQLLKTNLTSKTFLIVHHDKEHYLEIEVNRPNKEIVRLNGVTMKEKRNWFSLRSKVPFIFSLGEENFVGKFIVKYEIWQSHIKNIKLIINENIYYEN
jgi:hypothetical protein